MPRAKSARCEARIRPAKKLLTPTVRMRPASTSSAIAAIWDATVAMAIGWWIW